MLLFPLEKALQWAACGALANIAKNYEGKPQKADADCRENPALLNNLQTVREPAEELKPDAFLVEAVQPVASAMANFPMEAALQGLACAFLWQLATRDPSAIAETPGVKGFVEHAATTLGIRQAKWLLECVRWRSISQALGTRGGGRRRWGQWATGRRAAA